MKIAICAGPATTGKSVRAAARHPKLHRPGKRSPF